MLYSKRLAGPALLSTTAATLFTVPSGRVYVVQTCQVLFGSGSGNVTIAFGVNGTAAADRFYRGLHPVDSMLTLTQQRWVFAAGETCEGIVLNGAASALNCTLHGYDLDAS